MASWQVWLGSNTGSGGDASINSNVLRQTYTSGFLDVSNTLTVRYDTSLNGNVFINNPTRINCPVATSSTSSTLASQGLALISKTGGNTMALGVDGTSGVGFINSATSAGVAKPLSLQTFGGKVAIGNTAPSAALFVVGNQNTTVNIGGTYNAPAFYGNGSNGGNTVASFLCGTSSNTQTANAAVVEIGSLNRDVIPTVSSGTVYKYGLGVNTTSSGADFEIKAITTGANASVDGTPVSRLYINNAGYVGIGTTSPQVALSVAGYISALGICTQGYNSISYFGGNYNSSINSPAIFVNSPDAFNRYAVSFGSGSMANGTSTFTSGTIYGSITTQSLTTAYNTSSDYRLKENVVDLSNCLYVVTKLKPRQFNFIECPDAIQSGFIAHEVQEFVPNAVTHNKDEVDASGNMVTQQLDASKLIPFLVGAIQDLQAQLADVMARLSRAGIA